MADSLNSFRRGLLLSVFLFNSSSLLANAESAINSPEFDWTGRMFFVGFLLAITTILFALVNFVLAQPKPQSP
ncbi:hypothetical protein [Planctobacterium marinum]|uniref:hypothetical protein n=1 Tax=Planctobacterium marinum TaxID=1631968 RepID=UPI0030C67F0A